MLATLAALTASLASLAVGADIPLLAIDGPQPALISRSGLLARADARVLGVAEPLWSARLQVSVVPLADLLKLDPTPADGGVAAASATLEVSCADGFVAQLPRAALDNRDPHRPIAYLAVERPEEPWPLGGHDGKTATGPYAIVWSSPEGQRVPDESWAFAVVRLALRTAPAVRYPALAPQAPAGTAPQRGFDVFLQSCLPCHKLNGQGPAVVGPDLNAPQSPLDYLGPQRLAAFLRDPQSLRAWEGDPMPSFSREVLSDGQLADLLSYLADRQSHRAPTR